MEKNGKRIISWITWAQVNLQLRLFSKAICLSVMFMVPRTFIILCMPSPQPLSVKKIAQLRNYLPIFAYVRCILLFAYSNILKINETTKYFRIFDLAFFV